MNWNTAKVFSLAAIFNFAAATFLIVDGKWMQGVLFFAAASCFLSVAAKQRKKEANAKADGESGRAED